jgi:predicted PurR-regulated permease PerM
MITTGLATPTEQTAKLMKGVAAAFLAALIVVTLYLGRDVFVPIALAILLSFVLAPLSRVLENWHAHRAVSVISVVFLTFLSSSPSMA